jgi:methylated-DNA-[protein]-cysteine S-methyltransferase
MNPATGRPAADDRSDFAAIVALPVAGLRLGVRVAGDALSEFEFLVPGMASYRKELSAKNGVARAFVDQLQSYLADPGFRFDLPLAPRGSPFQHRIWAELAAIPSGEARRYGDIARRLGTAPRAVGGACRSNPLPIVVPCHRVVAAGGLGGYSGETAGALHRLKPWLLAHEGYRDGSIDGGRAAAPG